MKLVAGCLLAVASFVAGFEGSKIIPLKSSNEGLQQKICRLELELKAANDELATQPSQAELLGQARWAKEELEFLQDRVRMLGLKLPEQASNSNVK